jgi:hypothetical protein
MTDIGKKNSTDQCTKKSKLDDKIKISTSENGSATTMQKLFLCHIMKASQGTEGNPPWIFNLQTRWR